MYWADGRSESIHLIPWQATAGFFMADLLVSPLLPAPFAPKPSTGHASKAFQAAAKNCESFQAICRLWPGSWTFLERSPHRMNAACLSGLVASYTHPALMPTHVATLLLFLVTSAMCGHSSCNGPGRHRQCLLHHYRVHSRHTSLLVVCSYAKCNDSSTGTPVHSGNSCQA